MIVLRPLAAASDLATLIDDVRHIERLGFRVIALSAGMLGGRATNLVTLRTSDDGAPPAKPLQLEVIDGMLDQGAQEARLRVPDRECVCYGTAYVSAIQQNVAAFR